MRDPRKILADDLFRERIRSRGICQAYGFDGLRCWGRFECAHVIRRRFLSVAWDDENAACLCLNHHRYFTEHREAEDRFHVQLLGAERFAALKRRAEAARGAPDMDAVLARLKGVA